MNTLKALVKRNSKMFFKDKGMFFTAMITPLILLFLYIAFLGNVYKESFVMSFQGFTDVSDELLNGLVGGQLFASLLAVCCITVAFCSNMLMVQDKSSGTLKDFTTSPVKPSVLAMGYYISTFITTMLICLVACAACFIYLAVVGYYISVADVLLILLDVFLLVMFGTALSSIINCFLSTQGQISAVGTIVSAGYGFICGAYMPISQFPLGLQRIISFLPGTYGTSLIKTHAMRGAFDELKNIGFTEDGITNLKDSIDCNAYFFGKNVDEAKMYLIVAGSIVLLIAVYILINRIKDNKRSVKRV